MNVELINNWTEFDGWVPAKYFVIGSSTKFSSLPIEALLQSSVLIDDASPKLFNCQIHWKTSHKSFIPRIMIANLVESFRLQVFESKRKCFYDALDRNA